MSQAEFCRKEGVSPNTFASWKTIITRRDAAAAGPGAGAKRARKEGTPGFIRLSLEEVVKDEQESGKTNRRSPDNHLVAAELIDASGGRKLRIFNGADQSIVASVIAALAATQVG